MLDNAIFFREFQIILTTHNSRMSPSPPLLQHARQMILHPRHAGKLDDKRQPLLTQEHLPKGL